MNQQELLVTFQHTPLPEQMGGFERTCAPSAPKQLPWGATLIVEYSHTSEDFRFQVVVQPDDDVLFQTEQAGQVTPLRTLTLEETGHVLRSDLLMILEELEDEI